MLDMRTGPRSLENHATWTRPDGGWRLVRC